MNTELLNKVRSLYPNSAQSVTLWNEVRGSVGMLNIGNPENQIIFDEARAKGLIL